MSKSVATTSAILRAALLATTAFALAGSGAAWARVGVTSATDGDPIGKPPAEAERVLRIGIDVQANEVIRTGSNDRAHLVFLDGTALTVGPNAELTIDKFIYDPSTKTGELAINASKGVFRLVGGRISKTNPITIQTPSSTIGIRGGICVFDVQQGRTTSTFLFGYHMSVTGQGRTQDVTRPGSQVTTTSGGAPVRPSWSARVPSPASSASSKARAAAMRVNRVVTRAAATRRPTAPMPIAAHRPSPRTMAAPARPASRRPAREHRRRTTRTTIRSRAIPAPIPTGRRTVPQPHQRARRQQRAR